MGEDFIEYPVTMNYYLELLDGGMGRIEVMFADGGAQRIQVNLIGKERNNIRGKTVLDPPVNSGQKPSLKRIFSAIIG